LEKAIDRLEKELPVLRSFILPGGHITSAWAHVARTVCRRCERKVVPLINKARKSKSGEQYQNLFILLNRLSDYLFVLARHCNHLYGVSDKLWKT
jgi:cob(I)alamin adenosyltransferase